MIYAWHVSEGLDGHSRPYRFLRRLQIAGRCPNVRKCWVTADGLHVHFQPPLLTKDDVLPPPSLWW